MPLINSIIKAVMKQQMDNYIIIEESDGTQYMFNLDSPHPFIENETLEIRVDGLHRNYDLGGGLDTLLGTVLASYMDIPSLCKTPFVLCDEKRWNPVDQYGKKAAEHFFPYHQKGTYHYIEIKYPDDYLDGIEEHLDRCSAFRDSDQYDEMAQEASIILSKKPNSLESYTTMSILFMEKSQFEKAEKYLQTALKILESILPSDDVPYILKANSLPNRTYLKLLMIYIHLLMQQNLIDRTVDLAWKAYSLEPYDQIGIRFYINERTGANFPEMDRDQHKNVAVEPYRHILKYSIPIRDRYNPNGKQHYQTWLDWSPYYRSALITDAHAGYEEIQKMSRQEFINHLHLHELAETSIAENMPDIRLMLARMLASGVPRHEAIHEIGFALMENYRRSHHHDESCPECGHDSCDHDECDHDNCHHNDTSSNDGIND